MTDKQVVDYISKDCANVGLVDSPEWIHNVRHNYIYLFSEPACLLVHKSNPLAALSEVSLETLKNERVLALSKNTYYPDALNKAVEKFGFVVTPYFESDDMFDLMNMVNKGNGVVLCSKNLLSEMTLNNAVPIPVTERSFDCHLSFVFQSFEALDVLAQELIMFVKKAVVNKKDGAKKDGAAKTGNIILS